jgi:hypothetical protein
MYMHAYMYILYIYTVYVHMYIYIYVYPQPPGFAVNTILSSHLALCKGRCDRFTYVFLGRNRRCRVVVVMTFIRLRSFKCFFSLEEGHILSPIMHSIRYYHRFLKMKISQSSPRLFQYNFFGLMIWIPGG